MSMNRHVAAIVVIVSLASAAGITSVASAQNAKKTPAKKPAN